MSPSITGQPPGSSNSPPKASPADAARNLLSRCHGHPCPNGDLLIESQKRLKLQSARRGSQHRLHRCRLRLLGSSFYQAVAADGITSGCGNGNYCPDAEVTRAQMAVFLVKAFNLP
ncbi:MAG: S-layer homology domain-containing protein [Anaerolineales bacterium]|nr:S-layer homology domain-containing protein [Anaerolineales bacterium]